MYFVVIIITYFSNTQISFFPQISQDFRSSFVNPAPNLTQKNHCAKWIRQPQLNYKTLSNPQEEGDERSRATMASTTAPCSFLGTSFLSVSYSQNILNRPHLHFPATTSSSGRHSLVVEAKATTRREDRAARHSRIRKKVIPPSNLGQF